MNNVKDNDVEKRGRPKGRHPENWKRKTEFASVTIAGSPKRILRLKEKAKENDLSISRYVLDNLVGEEN